MALVIFLVLTWLVQRTRLGREVRAVAESPRAARILGVDVDRTIAASFFISSAPGGAAGVLFGLAFNAIAPDMGRSVELKGLAVIILGGMGSMPGAVIAGFALGLRLIGPNGAGKTTVINLISGLLQPTSGAIDLDRHPIHGLPPHRVAALGVARAFQTHPAV